MVSFCLFGVFFVLFVLVWFFVVVVVVVFCCCCCCFFVFFHSHEAAPIDNDKQKVTVKQAMHTNNY